MIIGLMTIIKICRCCEIPRYQFKVFAQIFTRIVLYKFTFKLLNFNLKIINFLHQNMLTLYVWLDAYCRIWK